MEKNFIIPSKNAFILLSHDYARTNIHSSSYRFHMWIASVKLRFPFVHPAGAVDFSYFKLQTNER